MNIAISNLSKSLPVVSNCVFKYNTIIQTIKLTSQEKHLHSLCRTTTELPLYEKLLQPASLPLVMQKHGMKIAGKVQRRCESCKLMWRKGRLYNLCKEFPRHNQMSNIPKDKSTWILTWASMSPRRPW